MPEIKTVWVQTAPARRLPEYPGAVEQGSYFVADGLLIMCAESGTSIGKPYRLEEDDDPLRIAGGYGWRHGARKATCPTSTGGLSIDRWE